MLSSIIRKLMVFLSFWYSNKNIVNEKEIYIIRKVIQKKNQKIKF